MRKLTIILFLSLLFQSQLALSAEDKEAAKAAPPSYLPLKPSLIANIQGAGSYARTDIQLMTKSPDALESITLHAPAIRHELLLLLSEQKADALKNPKGKEQFRKQALAAAQGVMKKLTGAPQVDDLYFTSFFAQ